MYLERTPVSGGITITPCSDCLVPRGAREAHITPSLLLFAARSPQRWRCLLWALLAA